MPHFEQFFVDLAPTRILHNIVKFIFLLVALRVVLMLPEKRGKKLAFVAINLLGICFIYKAQQLDLRLVLAYVLLVAACYACTRLLAFRSSYLVPTLMPICILAGLRYGLPAQLGFEFVGASYMAFRLSQLVIVVRNKIVPMPTLLDYLSFSFYLPTIFVGPINSYGTFISTFSNPQAFQHSVANCWLRMMVGGVKLLFLANILDRLTYKGLLLDGHFHPVSDLGVALIAYYLYLYCNFSGFCDVMIGASGLLGIKVSENFDAPFGSRNMKEFWNRWHITLSGFMRDMFFAPISKALVSRVPDSMKTHAIALTIAMVFILIGIWHGRTLNFLLFGIAHAIGVVANYYYDILLKKVLTVEQRRQYKDNRLIHGISVVCTFLYVSLTLFLFANTTEDIEQIRQHLIY